MATTTTTPSQVISETAQAESGPTKGSLSAQMQSQVGKTQNFEKAVHDIGSKMVDHPEQVTTEDADHFKSREARLTGQAQPPADSISAEAQRLASANERGTAFHTNPVDPAEQSRLDKDANFQAASAEVGKKMTTDANHVTKHDGDLLHSREQRAQGHTDKGGIASQAQQLAAENEKKGFV